MQLRALTDGAQTGTGTLTVGSKILGGVLITTNNSDAVTVTCQRDSSSGKTLLDISTATTQWIVAPIWLEDTETLYFSVTGTGGSAQFYEWVT